MKRRFFGSGGRMWKIYFRIKTWWLSIHYKKQFKVGGGKFPELHFYVIGVDYGSDGLFSIVKSVLTHTEYAISKGMTPVVNMRDFQSQYSHENENVWELFFEQPMRYNLDDVYGAEHVTFSQNILHLQHYELWSVADISHKRFERLKQLYEQCIRPTEEMKSYLQKGVDFTFGKKKGIMAVICRGTDYNNTLVGICKQPTAFMVIEKAKEMMKMNSLDYIYCATEDATIYKRFQDEFGSSLLPNLQQKYDDNKGKLLAQINKEKKYDTIQLAKDYFRSMYIVSQCDAFVGGQVCGTDAVMLMPNNFKDTYIFQLGVVTQRDINVNETAEKVD